MFSFQIGDVVDAPSVEVGFDHLNNARVVDAGRRAKITAENGHAAKVGNRWFHMSEIRLVPKAAFTPLVVNGWSLLHSCWDSLHDDTIEPFFKEAGQFCSSDGRRIQHQQVYLHGQSEVGGKRRGVQRVITLAKSTDRTSWPGKVVGQKYFEGDVEMPRPDKDPDSRSLCPHLDNPDVPYVAWDYDYGWRNLALPTLQTFMLSPGRVSVGPLARGPCNAFGRVWVRDSAEEVSEGDLPKVDQSDVVVTITAQRAENGHVGIWLTSIGGTELSSKIVGSCTALEKVAIDLAISMAIDQYRLKFITPGGDLLGLNTTVQSLILH